MEIGALGIFGVLLIILLLIIYIYTLVRQLKKKQYVWFVLTLLISVPVLIIYWIVKLFNGVK